MQSLDRGCRLTSGTDVKENGCTKVTHRPECNWSCRSDLCNAEHGDLYQGRYDQQANGASHNFGGCLVALLGIIRVFILYVHRMI